MIYKDIFYDNRNTLNLPIAFNYYMHCERYHMVWRCYTNQEYNREKLYSELTNKLKVEYELIIDHCSSDLINSNGVNDKFQYFLIENIGIIEIYFGAFDQCMINIIFKLNEDITNLINIIDEVANNYKIELNNHNLTKFFQISSNNFGFHPIELKIKTPNIKPEYYPNLDIDNIVNKLNSEKPGIIILSGHPGSGKSTLIKYLTSVIDKNFYNIANDMLDIFNQPSFQEFAINNLKDSVLIIEDCEKLVKSRKISNSNIATLLNLGDGLLGEALNIKIILTYNIKDDNVDTALLRKGRTLLKHEFGLIDAVNATNISKDLGKNIVYNNSIPLTEIFNTEDNNYVETKSKIGF